MNKKITMTETQLRNLIRESVEEILYDEEMDESWVGDKWKQTKSAVSTAFSEKGRGKSFQDRMGDAKKNWVSQGEYNEIKKLSDKLSDFIDKMGVDPNMTLKDFIGGKYKNHQFGKLSGMTSNRGRQIKDRGGNFYK